MDGDCAAAGAPRRRRERHSGSARAPDHFPAGEIRRVADPIADQYIVTLRGVGRVEVPAVANDLAAAHGGTVLHTYQYALRGFAVRLDEAQAAALSRNPRVELVEQDGAVHASGTQSNPPSWAEVMSFDDVSVVNGSTYYYQVAAVNAVGETRSAEESATPSAGPLYVVEPQGSWVGTTYGSAGYALGAWNSGSSDLMSLADATLSVVQGARWCWACSTSNVRALQSPDGLERRAATWYDNSQLSLESSFSSAFSGTLRLYALDWDRLSRRQTVSVNDGSGPQVVKITTAFDQGAWMSFPIDVSALGTVTITATRDDGANAVISGIFLDAET